MGRPQGRKPKMFVMKKPFPARSQPSRWLVAMLVLLIAASCRPSEEPPSLDQLTGSILPSEPYFLLPDRAWRRHEEKQDVWFFGSSASMMCQVNETPTEPIIFAFYPDEEQKALDLVPYFNGVDVSERSRILVDSGEYQVEIPPEMLPPGLHFLSLQQASSTNDEGAATTFLLIGHRTKDAAHVLPIELSLRFRYLSDLLQFSATGSYGREKMGGFIFVGPTTQEVALPSRQGGRFYAKAQNSTESTGFFKISYGDQTLNFTLGPHERQVLQVDIPTGFDRLTLSSDGLENGLYLWGSPLFVANEAPRRPPIIFVTLDTTRRDALAAYGGDPRIAPHLKAFSDQATVFQNAVTTAPWTLPSHASMFTGLYPSKHGAGVTSDHLDGKFETLAEKLFRHGYLTAGFAGGALASYRFGLGQGFGIYHDPQGFETRADQLTSNALQVLEDFDLLSAKAAPSPLPFFLFLNYFDPHYPFDAPHAFKQDRGLPQLLSGFKPDDPWSQLAKGPIPLWDRLINGEVVPDARQLELLRTLYDAEVAFMDQEIGRFFTALKKAGIYDDALIIAVADHGELLGEGGYFSHSSRLDSELVEVPMIIKWPRQKIGHRVEEVVSVTDLFPTVLRAAGIPVPQQDGLPLNPRGGAGLDRRDHVVMEEHDSSFHRLSEHMNIADHLFGFQDGALRQLIWDKDALCFDLDGGDKMGSICSDEHHNRARRWRLELEREAYQSKVPRIGLSNEERANLRALGYLR